MVITVDGVTTNNETTIDAEVVPALDRVAAEKLDGRIRRLAEAVQGHLEQLQSLVEEAKQDQIHKVLGYPSWTAYLADVFTIEVRLDREQRRELVGYLSGEGMSQRAIAPVVGVDQKTVSNDLKATEEISSVDNVIGLDGKRRLKQKEQKKDRRAPITKTLAEITSRMAREVDRLDKVLRDDRLNANKDALREQNLMRLGHIQRTVTQALKVLGKD